MHLQSVKDISLFLLLTNFSLFSKKTNSPCRSNNIHKDIWFNSIFASRKLTLLFSKASYQLGSNSDLPSCRLSLYIQHHNRTFLMLSHFIGKIQFHIKLTP